MGSSFNTVRRAGPLDNKSLLFVQKGDTRFPLSTQLKNKSSDCSSGSPVPLRNRSLSRCEKAPGEGRRAKTCRCLSVPSLGGRGVSSEPGLQQLEERPGARRGLGAAGNPLPRWQEPHGGILERKNLGAKHWFGATFSK